MLLHDVIQTIRRHNLLAQGQHILVGVSGGADSVALLAVLRRLAPAWKLRLTVAHLNHGIRGPAAVADAAFVAALARRWKLKFVGGRVNVPVYARRRGISLEMAGRKARYDFFAKAARTHHCDAVATAHTADDQAETILLNLARGAGAAGLAGIPYIGWHGSLKSGPAAAGQRCRSISPGRSPATAGAEPGERPLQWSGVDAVRKNRSGLSAVGGSANGGKLLNIKVVRPLRDVDRKSIERFLARGHLAWREDATNADPAFLRNRVRHEVLPFLEARLNPGIRQALLRASNILAEENEWLNILAEEILGQCRAAVTEHNLMCGNFKAQRILDSRFRGNDGMSRGCLSFPTRSGIQDSSRRLWRPDLDANRLSGFPVAARRRVLRRWLEACGLDAETLNFDAIERLDNLVADRRSSRAVTLAGGCLVRRSGDKLALSMDRHGNFKNAATECRGYSRNFSKCSRPTQLGRCQSCPASGPNSSAESVPAFSVRLTVPGQTRLPKQEIRIMARIGPGIVKERPASVGALPARASLSLRAWRKRRLVARSWEPGDRMRPLSMQGTKKLQDIFSDGKVPQTLRHRVPIIECQGEIVWIPGFRIAQGWEVRADEPLALQLTVDA